MKRKIIYGILSLLISFGLWLYVVTVVNPEWQDTFYNIPVVLENEEILQERGLMLVSEEAPTVTLRLSGNRADMIKLNASNITITADLSRIYSAGEQGLSYTIEYPGDVPSNAFEIISQTPQQITLPVVERKSKAVDVILKTTGEEPAGYKALEKEAVLDHEKITIAGPADVVDSIVEAEVIVDLTEQRETISRQFDYVLRDADGKEVESKWIKATPQKVHCTMKIQKVKDVTLEAVVVAGAGLTKDNCQIAYYDGNGNRIETPLRISGSETQLLAAASDGLLLNDTLQLGKIDLSLEIGRNTENGLVIEKTYDLAKLLGPYEITNQSGIDQVTVVVLIPNVTIREFTVGNIQASYDPTALNVDVTTKSLKVTLRGTEHALDMITMENLKVEVSFAGAEPVKDGDFVAKVSIMDSALEQEVFAVGSYLVEATVTAVGG